MFISSFSHHKSKTFSILQKSIAFNRPPVDAGSLTIGFLLENAEWIHY